MRVRRAPAKLRRHLTVIVAVPAGIGREDRQEHFRCAGCGILNAADAGHLERRRAAVECTFCRTVNVPAFRDTP